MEESVCTTVANKVSRGNTLFYRREKGRLLQGTCLALVSVDAPFYTDCGENIRIGKHVIINSGCKFQDQGGIAIGEDVFNII